MWYNFSGVEIFLIEQTETVSFDKATIVSFGLKQTIEIGDVIFINALVPVYRWLTLMSMQRNNISIHNYILLQQIGEEIKEMK